MGKRLIFKSGPMSAEEPTYPSVNPDDPVEAQLGQTLLSTD